MHRSIAWVFLFLCCCLLLSACAPPATPDQIAVQIKWVHQAQSAGFYTALDQGFFADENLQVELLEGGPGVDPLDMLTSGQADFAVASPHSLLMAIDRGEELKAIATIFQISPVVFVSMPQSGITRPQDFSGKTISVIGVQELEIQLHAMLDFLGLEHESVTLVPHSYDYDRLVSGQVDVQAFYTTSGLPRLQEAGYQVNLIYPGDYGVHHTGDCIVTSASLLEQDPVLALRFLRAFSKGWRYATEQQDQALETTMRYALEDDLELQRSMLTASFPLISTGRQKIGGMDPHAWQSLHDALLDQGFISQSIPLEQVIDPSFIERASSECSDFHCQ
jgi:NitT/TauT family transport system substrate-binding protein